MKANILVYAGFICAGKTTEIIRHIRAELDPCAKKLLLVCEQGEVEFDEALCGYNASIEYIAAPQALLERLSAPDVQSFAHVIVEYNGMWSLKELRALDGIRLISVMDGTQLFLFYANLRTQTAEQLSWSHSLYLTRPDAIDDTRLARIERLAHSLNGRLRLFSLAEGRAPVPVNTGSAISAADGVLCITPADFAYWYQALFAAPEKYDGAEVRLLCQNIFYNHTPEDRYFAGRYVMTCCEQDLQFWGVPVVGRARRPGNLSWENVTGRISCESDPVRGSVCPVLHITASAPAQEPDTPYILP